MSAADGIDDKTRRAQASATDPRQSAWVSANAGSGKTYVLSRRVIRLLLQGTDPARILCLTFTKAAAAEMSKRVFGELGRWTTLPDAELAQEIAALEGASPSPRTLAAARRLFAEALDTPGGLKIQTIHAFCERLLHQFPLEANVAGHFEVLDDRNSEALKDEARRAVLAKAADHPASALGAALKVVLGKVSDRTSEDSLRQFIDARDALRGWIVERENLDGAIAELRTELGVRKGETAEGLRQSVIDGNTFDRTSARRLLDALTLSKKDKDGEAAVKVAVYLDESADPAVRSEAWLEFFFTGRDLRKSFVTKSVGDANPELPSMLSAEADRLVALVDRIRTVDVYEATAAMLRLADGAADAYERLKMQRGVLDFEDLIVRTAALLARSDASRWVHYKLDRGIEHILVDEAQDTSPRQWQVVRYLVEEFFAGAGVSAATRTLFAVGDEKQSIFSFQGAVPAWFARMQRELGAQARNATYAFEDIELHLSFRSVPKVLAAVDTVFAAPEVHTGLTAVPAATVHEARRRKDPGRVVLWPRYDQPAPPQPDDWVQPLDHLGEESPEVKLSRRIASTIRGWLDRGEVLDSPDKDGNPRPIRPGGILILTRSRGALTDAINRELKRRDIPIAGADRMKLVEHIAVMDLMAAARVVLLPEDDLSLAALLKSPLIGLDEDALFALAYGRKGSLWSALGDKAAESPVFAEAKKRIDTWRDRADFNDPYSFFARILSADRGRHALLARLGAEAEDVIDAFLAEALAYEQANTPSLEGFLAWLEEGETEVKRDPDSLREEVRVMTVHGAKGLEADVVFLVDNGTPPVIDNYVSRVLPLSADRDPMTPGPVAWVYSTPAMPERLAQRLAEVKQRDEEEYRRLLYVGMTRARDRLYVVGMVKQKRKEDRRWHVLVEKALEPELTDRTLPNGDIEREWRQEAGAAAASPRAKGGVAEVALPAWATANAPPPPPPLRRLAPSTALGATVPPATPFVPRASGNAAAAIERGLLVHRMLQSLPDAPAEQRRALGARYLDAMAAHWPDADRAALLAEVLAIMANPAFAEAFAPGSRAEVEIAGKLGQAVFSGRLDRLAVTPDRVLVVDFKTNRPAPAALKDVPEAYVGQLAVYRAVLARLYPGRTISAALLWTDTPSLMVIPDEMLILAESRILAA
jgi:ATP-dependent helicase/nuclease subunit A